MADLTTNLMGNQEPVHVEETRGTAAQLTDYARGSKKGNEQGLATPKPRGDKIANEAMTNVGKNPTLSPAPAMVDRTNNLTGNQVPLDAKGTCASEVHRADYPRGFTNGNNPGLLLPKPPGNKIANMGTGNKVTTNKKMDDRVKKNGKQLNAKGRSAVLARVKEKRAWGKPLPKRGDVKKAIVEAGVKKLIDTSKAFCCAPGPFDVDAFVEDLPFPTRIEPTATLWDKVEV